MIKSFYQWSARVTFRELVAIMMDTDLEANGLEAPGEGSRILGAQVGRWHQWQNSVAEAVDAIAGRAAD